MDGNPLPFYETMPHLAAAREDARDTDLEPNSRRKSGNWRATNDDDEHYVYAIAL